MMNCSNAIDNIFSSEIEECELKSKAFILLALYKSIRCLYQTAGNFYNANSQAIIFINCHYTSTYTSEL